MKTKQFYCLPSFLAAGELQHAFIYTVMRLSQVLETQTSPIPGICCMHACRVTQSCPTLRPRGLWPIRLLCLWDSPGKNTGEGCHTLLQGIFRTLQLNPSLLLLLHQHVGSLLLVPPGNCKFSMPELIPLKWKILQFFKLKTSLS